MNRTTYYVVIFCMLGLGGLVAYQWRRTGELQKTVATQEAQVAEAREKVVRVELEARKFAERAEAYKAAADQMQERNKVLASQKSPQPMAGMQSVALAEGKVPDGDVPAVAEEEEGGGFMKGLAKMYSDPKMKEMMRSQQAMGVNMIYGGLAKELGLNKDEAREVLDILTERQMEAAENGMKMFEKGKIDPAKMEQAGQESQAARQARDQELQDVLGPERFKKFGDYEKTIGERMALEQVEKQLTAGGTPLAPGQSRSILDIMTQERLRTPPTALNTANGDQTQQLAALQSGKAVEEWSQSQEALNRRILDRTRPLLSPDQFAAFEAAQKQQLSMQQMGMRMGREMMAPGKK